MTDPAIEGPRLATEEDFPEILDLVDRCFQRRDGGMGDEWAHCYDETKPEEHAIIRRDGRVVSNIGCIRQTLKIGDSELEAAGITAVSTDPRYRGNGYMTQLLEFWLDRMDDLGIPLSELAGNRKRYGRLGWDNAGRDRRYRITERSFQNPPDRDEHVRRYDGSRETLSLVQKLYESQRFFVVRDEESFRTHLARSNLETVVYTEPGEESYLTFTRNESDGWIYEVVGTERGVCALLAYVFRTFGSGLNSLRTRLHPSDPLNALFGSWAVSSHWQTSVHRKVYVRDLPAVLDAFTGQIGTRWSQIGADETTLTLGIDEDDDAAELAVGADGATVRRVSDRPEIELNRRETARLLFGYPETVASYDGHPLLDAVLPLEFFIPRTDQV